MRNHVHFILRTGPYPLSRVLLTVLSTYASDFNRRHGRVGHLFQGRYKAFRISDDGHLLAVVRYIHRNPVDAKIVARSSDYTWSSDGYYRRGGGPPWLDAGLVKGILSGRKEEALRSYIQLVDTGSLREPTTVVGAATARKRWKGAGLLSNGGHTNQVVEEIARAVALAIGESPDRLRSPSRERSLTRARALTAMLAREKRGVPISCTAQYFGRDESTVAQTVNLLEAQFLKDGRLRNLFHDLRKRLADYPTVDP